MKKYTKEEVIFVPDPEGKWKVCDIKTGNSIKGQFTKTTTGLIILTENELLDLMQESIEYSHTILLREKASELLKSKLNNA
jgi:hypothetical protein